MIETPLVFTGSKHRLLPQLLPLFDKSKRRLVDLFAGGGSIYSNAAPYYEQVLANDIIGDLMELQRLLIFEPDATLAEVKQVLIEKDDHEGFKRLRADYNANPTPAKLFMLMLTSTNNFLRFNKKFKYNQTFGRRSLNSRTMEKLAAWIDWMERHKQKLSFSALDFEKVECGADDFVFLDPPYTISEAGYNAFWDKDSDERLFNYVIKLDAVGAKFCMTGFESHDGQVWDLMTRMEAVGFRKVALESNYLKVSRKGHKITKEVAFLNYEAA